MRALMYLLMIRFKNRVLSLGKNPAALILIVVLIALVLLPALTGNSSSFDEADYRDMAEVYGMMMVLYCAIFVMTAYGGLSKGASLYSMPDVNLIFPSPVSSKQVLFYGLIQQMGTSLLIGFFLLFQYGWMHSTYGITIGALALILLGYALTLFCGQLTAMVLYSLTTGSERGMRIAKAFLLGISALAALYLLFCVYPEKGRWLEAAVSALNGIPVTLFPVGGWTQAAVTGVLAGEWSGVVWGLSAVLIFTAVLVTMMSKGEADFYEDVLQATEVSFSAVTASKQGRMDAAIPGKVRLGRTGIRKGLGANSFYYKHRLESRRTKVFLLDRTSMIFILISIAFAVFMREEGVIPVFAFASYMQIFSVALGRWIRELMLPYIYMVPEPAFSKLMHCLRESFLRIAADAAALFVPVAFLLKLNLPETLACIGARISFGLLFTAGNILVQRLFGGVTVKFLALILYFIAMVLLVLPGVGAVILLTAMDIQILPADLQVLLTLILINLPVSLIVIFLCRNMLEYSELNYQ